ncbi:Pre-mRNA-splicing helicase BRR2 [Dispira simplex]|nr:Pre-mRNA-splicing helicase BRR2 [Dispira simplex]
MAEEYARNSQYQYTANSNLVQQADRSSRRNNEPSGDPESLWGKVSLKDMGDRAQRETAPSQTKHKDRKTKRVPGSKKSGTILSVAAGLEGLNYRPKTQETRQILELLLGFLHPFLGDQPQEVIRSAADSTLEVLKRQELRDPERKRLVEDIMDTKLTTDQFSKLVQLGKGITDYTSGAFPTAEGTEKGTLDENLGVAVVFDQEENEGEFEGPGLSAEEDDTETLWVPESDEEEVEKDADEKFRAGVEFPGTVRPGEEDEEGEETVRTHLRQWSGAEKGQEKPAGEDVVLQDIDAFWLQRLIGRYYPDAHTTQEKTASCMQLFATPDLSVRECENQLMDLFDYTHFDLVKLLTQNRDAIYWCTRLAQTVGEPAQVQQVRSDMVHRGLGWILKTLEGDREEGPGVTGMEVDQTAVLAQPEPPEATGPLPTQPRTTIRGAVPTRPPRKLLDLDALAFSQGGHFMSNRKVKLPEGSFKRTKRGYEEIHVPAPTPPPYGEDEQLVSIPSLPEWVQPAFAGARTLNRVQSRMFPAAFQDDENILLCAPTGAGKTNVAMLTILRTLANFRNPDTGIIDTDNFKMIYVAPMKALVQEMVGNFSSRLESFGIQVAELTGDRQLTKQQIAETQLIVTTPEKWDVVTRKATDRSYTTLVRLIIIDEIHLLHDDRGPVLESIVVRTLRTVQQTKEPVRLVGLSATLPNYQDVATFMRVDRQRGLFHFDASFRPCPLRQEFIGITEKKPIKRIQMMNEVTYEKVVEQAGRNQVLIFVHSRKETVKTAQAIREMALERDTLGQFLRHDSASREVLQTEAETVKDAALKELLPYGFAVHHAGLSRPDRTLVEELFADGHVQVLVSTATLAWGINLPAHTVIIKGTQVYNPEKGHWMELSPQDVLQMLGRAGRPQFDTFGEGIIITTHVELQFYLSLLNQQLPIESQLISRLPDILNAEIVLGSVRNREDAVQWLGYTYLFVRMLQNPALYGVAPDTLEDAEDPDPTLLQKRVDLAHSAASVLEKSRLIKYDKRTGRFQVTDLGRISSHYYITHTSMATYDRYMRPTMSQIELFRLFAHSEEFKFIPVREEEKLELAKLLERVPIPVKETIDEPIAKINVLLQAYISQLKLEGFALVSDMVYVTQSASRILRAMFEICLKCRWARLARRVLDTCKMVERRMWLSMSPLRQFKYLPPDLLRKLERKGISWDRYYDMEPYDLGELVLNNKAGAVLHKCIHQVPRLNINAQVQPVTRSLLRFELTLTPDFLWDERVHGTAETFWIMVEDMDGEAILYYEQFLLKQRYAQDEHVTTFTVPLGDPLPPNYFVTVLSDRWLYSETRVPVSFKHLILPEKYLPPTELLDMQALPVNALQDPALEKVYCDAQISHFNPIQTQVFPAVYQGDHNIFLGAPTGSGKTVVAELALFHHWQTTGQLGPNPHAPKRRCVYLTPYQDLVTLQLRNWRQTLGTLGGVTRVFEALTGELTADLKLLERADVILATPEQWDVVSRRWMQRKNVQSMGLVLADELHLIGSAVGPTYEVVMSRMRFMGAQLQSNLRIVALSSPLANAKDVAEWLGVSPRAMFNFNPLVRPIPLEITIQGYKIPHFPSLMLAMAKPTYLAIQSCPPGKNAIVFVPSRKQCRLTAAELLALCTADDAEDQFLGCEADEMESQMTRVEDSTLAEVLRHGIGYYHETLSANDQQLVRSLFARGAVRVLVASYETCWGLGLSVYLIVVMGTQYYEGREHRYVDYPMPIVLQMVGMACRPHQDDSGRCVLMCQTNKKEFYKKFLYEPLPVESHLDQALHDHFNAAVVTRTVENYQDTVDFLTWTFLYRRLTQNPNYYGLQGVTPTHLSDHLSELVENTLNDLATTKCIAIEDETNVSPLNLGMIAAYYHISYITVEMFGMSLAENTKLGGLLDIVTAASEFDAFSVRHREDVVLQRLYQRVPIKLSRPDFHSTHTKCHILLQAHFSRLQLPPDLASDHVQILGKIIPLLQACVDVLASEGWLKPALATMELAQMCVQAQWDTDSPLRQVPHFSRELIRRAQELQVESVFDIMEMDDEQRQQLFSGLQPSQVNTIAAFVNRYPEIEVHFELPDEDQIISGQPALLRVSLEREAGEEEDDSDNDDASPKVSSQNKPSGATVVGPVMAPFFPHAKDEGWWVVLGDPGTQTLASIKRVNFQQRVNVKLEFIAPEQPGDYNYQFYLMSDSYLGCDQEFEVKFHVEPDDEAEEETDCRNLFSKQTAPKVHQSWARTAIACWSSPQGFDGRKPGLIDARLCQLRCLGSSAVTCIRTTGFPRSRDQAYNNTSTVSYPRRRGMPLNELKLRCTEFDRLGNVTTIAGEFSKSELCAQHGLQVRDLRKIDSLYVNQLPAILVRRHAILVNLAHIRALIKADTVVLFDSFGSTDSFNQSTFIYDLQENLRSGSGRSNGLPFEFRALESTLVSVVTSLQSEMQVVTSMVTNLLAHLEDKIDREKLKELLQYSKRVAKFEQKVLNIRDAIVEVLEQDEDLAAMYLSAKMESSPRNVDDHEEVELLLETYLKQVEESANVISALIANMRSTEDIANIILDSQRNSLMLLELKVNIGMFGLTAGALVAGMFGMNLLNHHETHPMAFIMVTSAIFTMVMLTILLSFRKMNRLLRHI